MTVSAAARLVISTTTAVVAFTTMAEARPLATYLWKNRPLIVFAPNTASPMLRRQRAIVAANRAGFRNRDMVVIEIIGDRVRTTLGRPPGASAAAFRKYYGIARSATRAILVGKDGSGKLQSSGAISAQRLFGLIDSMPMRRQEIRRRGR